MTARVALGPAALDHASRPRHAGVLPAPDVAHERMGAACRDRVRFELNVVDGVVSAVRFRAQACEVATAAASLLAERVHGESLGFVEWLELEDVLWLLGARVSASRRPCALLPLETLQGAVRTFRARWDEER